MDKIDKIRKELERRIEAGTKAYSVAPSSAIGGILQAYENILSFINSLPEEPVNIDFEKELYKQFGQVKDFTLGMRIAKYFYEIGHKEEPVSEELRDAADEWSLSNQEGLCTHSMKCAAFKAGAKWQKNHLWKPADGDDLPEYEREVIVFTQNFPNDAGMMMIAIAHRPNPDGWDGKSIATGKVSHYEPKTYDKGGWNMPDVKYWLDVKLPNMEESV